MYRRWTVEEDETARELAADGYTFAEVAAELGRPSVASIKGHFHRTGYAVGRDGPAPDARLRADLMALLASGVCPSHAARQLGRDRAYICRVARALESQGLLKRTGYGRWTRWRVTRAWSDTDGEVPGDVRALAADGLGPHEIARRTGWHPDTVSRWLSNTRERAIR